MKICIVTPDLAGPIKNGGIGTFCASLCKLLRANDHELTLLFTEEPSPNGQKNWKEAFRCDGISIQTINTLKNEDPYADQAPHEPQFLRRSRRIAEYLDATVFDLVHFQDWKANGFHSIRLRRSGLGLTQTRIAVTLHSPSLWLRQGMNESNIDPIAELTLDFAERYCCENADELIAPTQHMLDWASTETWRLQANQRVLPYCYHQTAETNSPHPLDPSHIIFFGRLETRKGLGIFIEGLQSYLDTSPNPKIRDVTFLGKPGRHQNQSADKVLLEWQRNKPRIRIHLELEHDTHSAIRHIRQSGGIAFLPSLLDNCPLAVIECIEHRIPFLAARSGGIPEIVHPQQLFDPTAAGIAQALHGLHEQDWDQTHPYSADRQNQRWIDLHAEFQSEHLDMPPVCPRRDYETHTQEPKVSVCVPHYNQPEYLPQALESIQQNHYRNVQVIVCDDGSSTKDARRIFEEQKNRLEAPDWVFLEQANGGVGSARNRAAAAAEGEYLVFMDSDNLARPQMVGDMVRAMQHSGADALTCYFTAFSSATSPKAATRPDFVYRPLGAVPLLCLLENTFGDANCILKRSVFEAVGGFRERPLSAYADWDFFLRLHLAGYRVDIIPRELFWYRHRPDSMLRMANTDEEHRNLLGSALETQPTLACELSKLVTLPLFKQLQAIEKKVGRDSLHRLNRAPVPWHKHIYRGYRRLLGDPRYQKRLD